MMIKKNTRKTKLKFDDNHRPFTAHFQLNELNASDKMKLHTDERVKKRKKKKQYT